jgi:hypothetical protein
MDNPLPKQETTFAVNLFWRSGYKTKTRVAIRGFFMDKGAGASGLSGQAVIP